MMNLTINPISLLLIPVFAYLVWIGAKDFFSMLKKAIKK
jgi:hypothetical protein